MSSHKRPYAELSQAPSQPSFQRTPSRNGPSTPHAIRALQQRSATKERSAKSRRTLIDSNAPRPDSARGILRRLAQLTAPTTKRRTVTPVGKENTEPVPESVEYEDTKDLQKPGLTLPIGDTLEDEDSELPTAPTPSVLPNDDDHDPTMTFKAIDFARRGDTEDKSASERIDRRRSRLSFYSGQDDDNDDDGDDETMDITAEIGRRALSEGPPTERFLSRGSFGSIRMSDFGIELERRRTSDFLQPTVLQDYGYGANESDDDTVEKDLDAETENLRRLQRSASRYSEHDLSMQVPAMAEDEDTFRLDLPDDNIEDAVQDVSQTYKTVRASSSDDSHIQDAGSEDESSDQDVAEQTHGSDSPLFVPHSPPLQRKQIAVEAAVSRSVNANAKQPTRRKGRNLKRTRHGHVVPALPSSLIKHIATRTQALEGKRPPKLGREHMRALEQATEWFFEQIGEDLEAYSDHAGRKKRVVEDDALLLLKRQKIFREKGQLQAMAETWLTPDVRGTLDLPDKP